MNVMAPSRDDSSAAAASLVRIADLLEHIIHFSGP
jgi:hypothetical protein